jgi:hypothetical protein
MKTLLWIIVLIAVVWGIWWFATRDDIDTDNQPAAAGQSLDINGNVSASSTLDDDSSDGGPYEDKG